MVGDNVGDCDFWELISYKCGWFLGISNLGESISLAELILLFPLLKESLFAKFSVGIWLIVMCLFSVLWFLLI